MPRAQFARRNVHIFYLLSKKRPALMRTAGLTNVTTLRCFQGALHTVRVLDMTAIGLCPSETCPHNQTTSTEEKALAWGPNLENRFDPPDLDLISERAGFRSMTDPFIPCHQTSTVWGRYADGLLQGIAIPRTITFCTNWSLIHRQQLCSRSICLRELLG